MKQSLSGKIVKFLALNTDQKERKTTPKGHSSYNNKQAPDFAKLVSKQQQDGVNFSPFEISPCHIEKHKTFF